jgi:hypothetical protein
MFKKMSNPLMVVIEHVSNYNVRVDVTHVIVWSDTADFLLNI